MSAHPCAQAAIYYIKTIPQKELELLIESLQSAADEGDMIAARCYGTFCELAKGGSVLDSDCLGLAWILRDLRDGLKLAKQQMKEQQ